MKQASRLSKLRSVLLLLALLLSAGCSSSPGSSEDTIKIVSSLPLTGSSRVQSETMVLGIQMALEDANYKAGHFKIEYSSWDDASAQAGSWDPSKEKENASRASANPDVMAYIGTYNSGAAKIAIPILNQAQLVMISPANTYSGLTKPGLGDTGEPLLYYPLRYRNFCRVVPADDLQGVAGAWWAKELGVKKVYVLDDKELYGRGLARVFRAGADRLKLEVVGQEGIDSKAPDFRSVVTKVLDSKAELVYFGGITQNGAGKLVKDLRSGGYKGYFLSPDGTKEDAFLESAGAAGEGCLVTLGGLPPEQMVGPAQDWFKSYRERYHREPEAYAIYSYEATKVTLDGIAKANVKDRSKIREAIMQTANHRGLLGDWSFDPNGDTTLTSMSGYVIKGGKFQFAKGLNPDPKQFANLSLSQPKAAEGDATQRAFSISQLLQQLLNGLSNGALIAIVALGYTLVYGLVELINFAHGDVFMMGSLAALTGVVAFDVHSPPSVRMAALAVLILVGTMMFSATLNQTIDRFAYKKLRGGNRLAPLITAIGVSFILMNLGGYWKGWAPLNVPDLLGPADINLLPQSWGLIFKVSQLIVLGTTFPLLGGLYWFINRTKLGKSMRATAQNPQAAQLMGINTDRTIRAAFLIGGALAGAAGFLYAFYNHEVRFDLGFRQGLNAFTAAVLGGIGSVTGAVLGGLLIGLVEALTSYYFSQALAPAAVFLFLIVVIMIRPSGLLGDSSQEKV